MVTLAQSPIIVAPTGSPEWYRARSTGIGASEIAAAAGLSRYCTPLELYHRKRGELPDDEDNKAMRLGRKLEPIVKSEWSELTGRTFIDDAPPMFRHPEFYWCLATPDGIVSETEVFEGKTAGWRQKDQWGETGSDWIPDAYMCQTQQQMAVCGASLCHVAVLFDGRDLRVYEVPRNDRLIELLLAAGDELWERVIDGCPPEPTWEHSSTPKLIKEIHSSIRNCRVELPPEIVALWEQRREILSQIRELEQQADDLKSRVMHVIGDNRAGLLGNGKMIRRQHVEAKQISYERSAYVDAREVKADDQGMLIPADVMQYQMDLEARWLQANTLIEQGHGWQIGSSEHGSVYWQLPNGRKVRVANHSANSATRDWMQREDVAEIRVDISTVNIPAAVAAILAAECAALTGV